MRWTKLGAVCFHYRFVTGGYSIMVGCWPAIASPMRHKCFHNLTIPTYTCQLTCLVCHKMLGSPQSLFLSSSIGSPPSTKQTWLWIKHVWRRFWSLGRANGNIRGYFIGNWGHTFNSMNDQLNGTKDKSEHPNRSLLKQSKKHLMSKIYLYIDIL